MAKKTAQPGAPQPRKPKQKKIRLDDLLIERGDSADRGEALRAVLAHEVRANDVYPTSAAVLVNPDADVFVRNRRAYVSRGGHELQGALDAFAQDVRGACCIDIGSSTGGFTDCLLQAGAAEVACVDVNYGQLAARSSAKMSVCTCSSARISKRPFPSSLAHRSISSWPICRSSAWPDWPTYSLHCVRLARCACCCREAPVRKRPRRNRPRHRAR